MGATYTGPWQQGADYQRPMESLYLDVPGRLGTATLAVVAAAPFNDEMNQVLDMLPGTWAEAARGGPGGTIENTGYDGNSTSAEQHEGGGEWTAANILNLDYYYANHLSPNRPADAIGYEFEAAAATPVSASLHLEMTDHARDDTAPAGTPESSLSPRIAATLAAGRSATEAATPLANWAASGGAVHMFDFDMTSFMGPLGECGVWVSVQKAGGWSYYDPASRLAPISCSTMASSAEMTYWLHPPRHRWLYATPQPGMEPPALHPCRQYPRSDGLAASSARRHYPPAPSRQGSRRHSGGYF